MLPADSKRFPSAGVTASLRETVVLGSSGDNRRASGVRARLELLDLFLEDLRPRAFFLSSLVSSTEKSFGMFCMFGSCRETLPVAVLVMDLE